MNMARCNSLNTSRMRCGAGPSSRVGHLPLGLAVAQATDTVYVANAKDGTVSVINGATCNGSDTSGCAPEAGDRLGWSIWRMRSPWTRSRTWSS